MKHVAFDTSAINWFFKNNIDGKTLVEKLVTIQLLPVIGTQTIIELAQDFLNTDPENLEFKRTKALFQLIKDLNPRFTRIRTKLYQMEARRLRCNTPSDWFLEPSLLPAILSRIHDYANGIFSQQDFIHNRKEVMEDVRQIWMAPKDQLSTKPVKDFKHQMSIWLENFTDKDSVVFRNIQNGLHQANINLSTLELLLLANNLILYPALGSLIRSWMYLCFITETNSAAPSFDKIPDSIQITEASYCSLFVVADKGAMKRTSIMVPSLLPIAPDALMKLS